MGRFVSAVGHSIRPRLIQARVCQACQASMLSSSLYGVLERFSKGTRRIRMHTDEILPATSALSSAGGNVRTPAVYQNTDPVWRGDLFFLLSGLVIKDFKDPLPEHVSGDVLVGFEPPRDDGCVDLRFYQDCPQ